MRLHTLNCKNVGDREGNADGSLGNSVSAITRAEFLNSNLPSWRDSLHVTLALSIFAVKAALSNTSVFRSI